MARKAEDVRVGGWVAATYKAFCCFDLDDPVFDAYEATILAGKAVEALSAIRALGKIDGQKFEIYRQLSRLKPKQGAAVFEDLERLGAVQVDWKKEHGEKRVAFITPLAKDKAEVFAVIGEFFRASSPSEKARASIEALNATVRMPLLESEAISILQKRWGRL